MKIVIGSDHGGYRLKEALKEGLLSLGYDFFDAGCHGMDSVDYPDYGKAVGEAVARGEFERGIVVCGTGIGISIPTFLDSTTPTSPLPIRGGGRRPGGVSRQKTDAPPWGSWPGGAPATEGLRGLDPVQSLRVGGPTDADSLHKDKQMGDVLEQVLAVRRAELVEVVDRDWGGSGSLLPKPQCRSDKPVFPL